MQFLLQQNSERLIFSSSISFSINYYRLLIDVSWILKDEKNIYGDNLLLIATFNNDFRIVQFIVGRIFDYLNLI